MERARRVFLRYDKQQKVDFEVSLGLEKSFRCKWSVFEVYLRLEVWFWVILRAGRVCWVLESCFRAIIKARSVVLKYFQA